VKERQYSTKKRWTQEELDYLEFCWNNPDKTWRDVAEATGRRESAITMKASLLNLKKVRYSNMAQGKGYKYCSICKQNRPKALFRNNHVVCSVCKTIQKQETKNVEGFKTCRDCGQVKEIKDFTVTRNKYTNLCKSCKNEKYKAYILKRLETKGY
jgi:hypothetical protein